MPLMLASASSASRLLGRRLLSSSSSAPCLREPRQTPNVMHGTRLATDPRWRRRLREDLYRRRLLAGPEPDRPRSVWSNWNRTVELAALRRRLRLPPQLDAELLERVFLYPSSSSSSSLSSSPSPDAAEEAATNSELEAATNSELEAATNSELSLVGLRLARRHCDLFLRHQLPHLPPELRRQVVDSLTSVASLAEVGGHLGLKDLAESGQWPLSLEAIAGGFCSLLAACAECGDAEAWRLVRDFLLVRLHSEDVNELYELPDSPDELLRRLLSEAGCRKLEFRLLAATAPLSPAFGCFRVGAYANRQLLAASFGETPLQAKLDAARESLKLLFGTEDCRPPLDFRLELSDATEAGSCSDADGDYE